MPLIQFFVATGSIMGMALDTDMVLLWLRLSGHPAIAMALDLAIATLACSDSDKTPELNTVMAAAMDLEEGASSNLAYAATLDIATPMAMSMDPAMATNMRAMDPELALAASDSDTDLDSNTARDTASNTGLVQPLASASVMAKTTATDTDIDSTPMAMEMDPADTDLDLNTARNTASNTGLVQPLASATVMATTTATDTAIDSKKGADMGLDPNIAPDIGMPPIQHPTSATAMATVTVMDSEQTVSSAVASQSDNDKAMDLDSDLNTARNTASDMGLVQPLASVTAMATRTGTVTAKDSEEGADMGLDLNIAPDTASDTAPIQPPALATATASVTQTVESNDDDSRFSQEASSEEFEFMGDDDVTKEEKKQKLE
jgi:hypothetical protein